MKRNIPLPTMKNFLWDEVMKPLNISVSKLAHDLQVPKQKIENILDNRQKVDADLSIRLGHYFNVDEDLFLNIQNNLDTEQAKENHAKQFSEIKPFFSKNNKTSLA